MTETSHDFISIGIPLGAARLTVSASSISSAMRFFADLNDVDLNDPDGLSPVSYLLDHINTINAAVALKMPQAAPAVTPTTPATPAAPASNPAPGEPPLCDTHQMPMKWEPDGIVRSGQNAGRHFQAWKCTQPYTPGVKCGFKSFSYK